MERNGYARMCIAGQANVERVTGSYGRDFSGNDAWFQPCSETASTAKCKLVVAGASRGKDLCFFRSAQGAKRMYDRGCGCGRVPPGRTRVGWHGPGALNGVGSGRGETSSGL